VSVVADVAGSNNNSQLLSSSRREVTNDQASILHSSMMHKHDQRVNSPGEWQLTAVTSMAHVAATSLCGLFT
jgi:hypothetical protein